MQIVCFVYSEMGSRFFLPTNSTGLAPAVAFPDTHAVDRENTHARLEDEVVGLFDQFRERLLRYLFSLGLSMADGEEVIQEVFLSLFQHLQGGKPRHNLRGWLFRVAHNLALKRRYRNRRDSEVLIQSTAEDWAVDAADGPERQLLNGQVQQRLLAVVEALPEQDRRCLSLRAEGVRYREIAEILDMSLSAVSLSLSRSIARMVRSAER